MERPATLPPAASMEEMRALAATLEEGEQVRWCVRQQLPRRWNTLSLILAGLGLTFIVAGAGFGWALWDSPPRAEWARMGGVDMFFALLGLLFHLVPLIACWAVGGGILRLCLAPRAAGLCAFTDRRIIEIPASGEPHVTLLTPGMDYQLCPAADGRSGGLVFSARAQMLTSPLGCGFVDGLPDLRAAEELLLALTRAELPPEAAAVPLSRFLADASETDRALVQGALCRGERLLWVERPKPAFFPYGERARFAFFVLFTSFALGFAGLAASAAGAEGDWGGALIPGGIVGFLLLAGIFGLLRPLRCRRAMVRTLYLLTDRRALIIEPSLLEGWHIFAYPLGDAPVKECRTRADGSGDLVFSGAAQAQDIQRGFRGFLNVRDWERTWQALAEAVAAREGTCPTEGAQERG